MFRPKLLLAAVALLAVSATNTLAVSRASARKPVATPATTAASTPLMYSTLGKHAVGYRQFTTRGAQHRSLKLRVWYPAVTPAGGATPTIRYVQANKFDAQDLPVKRITAVGTAAENALADIRNGPYPLVVFSHGYALSPIVYSTLVEHYVSHGFVVLAPEHNETFDRSLGGFWKALIDRPADIKFTVDYAEKLTKPGSSLAGLIDVSRTAVVGHSYGGYTALAAAGARYDLDAYNKRCAQLGPDDPLNFFCAPVVPRETQMAKRVGRRTLPTGLWPSLGDSRVKAVISMAGDAYLFDQRGLAHLTVPVMAMGGTIDEGTPYTWGARLTYDHAASVNKSLVTFTGAGHMVFADPCDNLPWTRKFSYGDAFCNDAVWGTKRPLGVVKHYSTAFLLDSLKDDRAARISLVSRTTPPLRDVAYETSNPKAP